MEYVVAIPSYQRPETLQNKTLRLLQDYEIEPERIHIFVANKKEEDNYRNSLEPESYHKLIRGRKGVKNIRNFMSNYFDEGQPIFYIDDDISQLFQNYNDPRIKQKKVKRPRIIPRINSNYDRSNNYLTKLPCLKSLIQKGFEEAQERKMDNWGIYPVENPYFMKPTSRNNDDFISTKLNYLMGGLTGVFNNREAEKRTLDDKEDYERSIKYYLKDDGVIRFNNVCARTNCYTEPGGMQVERTPERIHKSAVTLCDRYPELCSLNTQKKSGFSEVRLRDTRNTLTGLPRNTLAVNNRKHHNNKPNHQNTKTIIIPLPEPHHNLTTNNNNNNNSSTTTNNNNSSTNNNNSSTTTNNNNNNNSTTTTNNNNSTTTNNNNNNNNNHRTSKKIQNATQKILKYLGGQATTPPNLSNINTFQTRKISKKRKSNRHNPYEVEIPAINNNQPPRNNKKKGTRKRLRGNYMKKRKLSNTRNNFNNNGNNQNAKKGEESRNNNNPYENANNNINNPVIMTHIGKGASNRNNGTSGNIPYQNKSGLLNMLDRFQSGNDKPVGVTSSNIREENKNPYNVSGLLKINLNEEKKKQNQKMLA